LPPFRSGEVKGVSGLKATFDAAQNWRSPAAGAQSVGEALQRRMLMTFLAILLAVYAMAVVSALAFDSRPSRAQGECVAVALSALGVALLARIPVTRWRYRSALACASAAPLAALIFHHEIAAQVWSVIPLTFVAVYFRMWQRPDVARMFALAIAVAAIVVLGGAPAPVPNLWLVLFAVCICGGAEVFGVFSAALLEVALRDPLTAAWNRIGLDRQAALVVSRARRRRDAVTVVVLDVDDFKSVNDRGGHAAGDLVLVELTQRWMTQLPTRGVIGRVGGDEFVVILSGLDPTAAHDLARTLVDGHSVNVTYGLAAGAADGITVVELLAAADEDLYRRKRERLSRADEGA
jgi:diguanylate cyclase (GGDEF)-like protein